MATIKLATKYPVVKELVWEQLVHDELMSDWCMPCSGFALVKGQAFTFQIDANAFFDGTFYNTVTDFADGAFLEYRCVAKKPVLDTVVRWTLTEQDGATTLNLEHSGFKGSAFMTKTMLTAGWKKMMTAHLSKKLTNKTEE